MTYYSSYLYANCVILYNLTNAVYYMTEKIAQGAEAVLTKENGILTKERIAKGYRIRQIDEKIRKSRTRSEANLMRAARRAGINVPAVVDESEFSLRMEYIDGNRVKGLLDNRNYTRICQGMGESIAKLHERNIIHGDLTTSNMILEGNRIFLIDFGLGFQSNRIEDKATDLHLLKEALESTHFDIAEKAWNMILKVYGREYAEGEKVIKALSKIEKRGRYKER